MSGAAAEVGGGLINAGATLGAAALAGDNDPPKPKVTTPNLQADFLTAAGSQLGLLGTGLFDPGIFQESSPLNQAVAAIRASPNKASKQTKYVLALQRAMADPTLITKGSGNFNKKIAKNVEKALTFTQFTSINDLANAQQTFQVRAEELGGRFGPTNEAALAANLAALQQRSDLVQNFETFGGQDVDELQAQLLAKMLRDINQGANQQSVASKLAAQQGGFNPGAVLGEIEKERFNATQDANINSITNALAILQGQTGVAGGQLEFLDQAIRGPQQNAANFAALRTGQQGQVFPSSGAGESLLPLGVLGAGQALGDPNFLQALGQLGQRAFGGPATTSRPPTTLGP